MTFKAICLPIIATLILHLTVANRALSQTAAGAGLGTGADEIGTSGGIGTLDMDSSFSAVDRGEAIGATADTGEGLSGATGGRTAGAALGGFGGGLGGGIGGLGGFGGFGGLGGLFGGGRGNAAQNAKPAIRTRLRSAIEISFPPAGYVQQNAATTLRSVSPRAGLGGVGVTMQDGTAIVTGVVRTEGDRRMSELLMRLEPGVRNVENRVRVLP